MCRYTVCCVRNFYGCGIRLPVCLLVHIHFCVCIENSGYVFCCGIACFRENFAGPQQNATEGNIHWQGGVEQKVKTACLCQYLKNTGIGDGDAGSASDGGWSWSSFHSWTFCSGVPNAEKDSSAPTFISSNGRGGFAVAMRRVAP